MAHRHPPSLRRAALRPRLLTTWILSALLAAFFAAAALGKLNNAPAASGLPFDEQFVAWGFPAWMRLVVGGLELAGALGVLAGVVRFPAAAGLALLMVGAIGTHVANAEWAAIPFAAVPGLAAGTLAYLARPARAAMTPSAEATP